MNILRKYLRYPIVVMVTLFADEKKCKETDKIIRFVVVVVLTSDEESMRSAGAFSVSAEQL